MSDMVEKLAGFLVIAGDASFVARYGAQISAWGFVLALVGFPLSSRALFRSAKPKRRRQKIKGND
jgi:hypothetical protein